MSVSTDCNGAACGQAAGRRDCHGGGPGRKSRNGDAGGVRICKLHNSAVCRRPRDFLFVKSGRCSRNVDSPAVAGLDTDACCIQRYSFSIRNRCRFRRRFDDFRARRWRRCCGIGCRLRVGAGVASGVGSGVGAGVGVGSGVGVSSRRMIVTGVGSGVADCSSSSNRTVRGDRPLWLTSITLPDCTAHDKQHESRADKQNFHVSVHGFILSF